MFFLFFYSIILSLLLFRFHSSPSRSRSCNIFTVWVCTSFYSKIPRDAASIFLLLFKPLPFIVRTWTKQNKIKQEEVEEEEEEKSGTTDWRLFHGETKEKRINKRAHKLLLLLLRVDTHLYTPFVCAPFCRRLPKSTSWKGQRRRNKMTSRDEGKERKGRERSPRTTLLWLREQTPPNYCH